MKGFKAFNKDLTCRNFQYEIGKEYTHNGDIELCHEGFHFCKKIVDIQGYYNLRDEETRLCEIEATGKIIEGDDKCVTDKIKIIRELTREEMYELGHEGKENRGLGNTGNRNTGDSNTGNRNTGDSNTGNRNTGNRNTGDRNTGNRNTGDSNTGNRNTGDSNTGDRNTGDSNTGNRNTGNRNTGDRNTGYSNTGYRNTGDRNTGDWNKTNRSAGVFCNKEPKLIMFNKNTDMTWEEWRNSEAYDILTRVKKSVWIWYDEMSEEEKKKYPSAKTCDGYLKEIERKVGTKEWWDSLETHEKATIIQLPNFNLNIFNDIMELEISRKEYKEIQEWLRSR